MALESPVVSIGRTIHAPAAQVYLAFTNATYLRSWLSDVATADPRPGGRIYLAWNSGYYTAGEFTSLEPDRHVAFTWLGKDEPGQTRVEVNFETQGEQTTLTLRHTGLGDSERWEAVRAEYERNWNHSLDNLRSVLETGEDRRITRRPMLGISLGDFTPDQAQQLHVPVQQGLRLDSVVDGLGAQQAGLQKDDVIVGLERKPVTSYSDFAAIISRHQAGDLIEVEFYRGAEKKSLQMSLSARPMVEIPWDAAECASRLRAGYAVTDRELQELLAGIREDQSSHHPGDKEWGAKEILAHLIHVERDNQVAIADMIGAQERVADGFSGNSEAMIAATVAVYPTADVLLQRLMDAECETANAMANLPDDFVRQKALYWRMAYNLLQYSAHTQAHIEQIREAIIAK